MRRSNGGNFIRGYFRFLRTYTIILFSIGSAVLLIIALLNFFFPEAHLYERMFRPVPLVVPPPR